MAIDLAAAFVTYALEIDCARYDRSGEVTHLGGLTPDGTRWWAALEVIIARAESGERSYFVTRGGQQLGLRVKAGELVTMVGDGWSVHSLPRCG